MELFQFANVEPLNPEQQPDDVPIARDGGRRQPPARELRRRLRHRGKGARRRRVPPLNFLGGARSAGAHVRWSSLDRGIRLDFNQPYFFAPHFSLGGEGAAVVHLHAGVPLGRDRREGDADAPAEPSSTSWSRLAHERARQQHRSRRSVLNDPTLRSNLIALGLDPDHRRAERHAQRARLRFAALDRRQPAERASRLSGGVSRRAGRAHHARHLQLLRAVRPTAATTCRSGDNASCSPAALQLGNIRPASDDPANVPFAKKYFLGGATSVRGWGRYEVSPLVGRACRSAATACSRSARSCAPMLHGNIGGVLFLDAGNVWADSWGMRAERSALRRRPGSPLSDAGRADPLRLRLPAQSDPRAARERRAADAALAHPLQHRAGVLEADCRFRH